MSKSLSELRASPHVGRMERTHPVCIARRLTAKYEALLDEEGALEDELAELVPEEPEEKRADQRIVDTPDPRIAEIDARLKTVASEKDALARDMEEHTGDVLLRALLPEEWEQWKVAHPPREEGVAGFRADIVLAGGECNVDALIGDLHLWAKGWNSETIDEDGWRFIASNAPRGSLKRLAALVVGMHESDDVTVPKSRRASSGTSEGATV